MTSITIKQNATLYYKGKTFTAGDTLNVRNFEAVILKQQGIIT